MRRFNHRLKDSGYLIYRWISPAVDPLRLFQAFPGYLRYFRDWLKYSKMAGAEPLKLANTYPCLHDQTATSPFDRHYFYQDIWAFKKIYSTKSATHVDVGSRVDFVGFLTAITQVTFVDIRPLEVSLENFQSIKGSILSLPFADNSVPSLSCLHVAEHIGLGRYGDQLDPQGTKKACQELARVLLPKGNLYFSLPVGKPRLCFNGHRIHSPHQILEYFGNLKLVELSGITDSGGFVPNIQKEVLEKADYACGLFQFTKS